MKVVDPDWFLNKYGQHFDKAAQGKAGIVIGQGRDLAFDNNPAGLQMKAKAAGQTTADWEPFHPWEKTGTWVETIPQNPFLISSKSSDAKVQRSIEILDWLAGEEGFLLTRYGKKTLITNAMGKTSKSIKTPIKKTLSTITTLLKCMGGLHHVNQKYSD